MPLCCHSISTAIEVHSVLTVDRMIVKIFHETLQCAFFGVEYRLVRECRTK
jgi:hypothetical protein